MADEARASSEETGSNASGSEQSDPGFLIGRWFKSNRGSQLRTLICVHFRSFKRVRIFDVLDTFSDFKKPIHLSEITISAYSNSDEDLAIQAEIAKNI